MAQRSIANLDSMYWSKLQSHVHQWMEKTGPSILVLYIPRTTERNPVPSIKFEGSSKLQQLLNESDTRQVLLDACMRSSFIQLKELTLKESMEDIPLKEYNMDTKRMIIANLTKVYMKKKYELQKDYWGVQGLKPEFWPEDVPFISPNERRRVGILICSRRGNIHRRKGIWC